MTLNLKEFTDESFMLIVEAPIFLSEEPSKVEHAIKQIFPDLQTKFSENNISAESKNPVDLLEFADLLRNARVLDASRKVLLKGKNDSQTSFMLHKQAAYIGKLNFCDENGESPLGAIWVSIVSSSLDLLIDKITPKWEWEKLQQNKTTEELE